MHGNLLDALEISARTDKGIRFVRSSEQEDWLSYATLRERALGVLAGLQYSGLMPGDELVFQFDAADTLLITYWACLHGGIVPVPLELGDQSNSMEKVFAVWPALGNPWLAIDADKTQSKYEDCAAQNNHDALWAQMRARLLRPMDATRDAADAVVAEVAPDTVAFVQYSSGSTGRPKGVALTHANLLSNILDMFGAYGHTRDDRYLSWKPLTHDFGMIAFHLAPVVGCNDLIRLDTDAFIWNPALWMICADRYRATILGAPNFGYRHFLKMYRRARGGRKSDWDLSSIRVIMNGAEPISVELCEEFMSELARFGMRPQAMKAGYGLAETALLASLCPLGEVGVRALTLDRRRLSIGETIHPLPEGDPHGLSVVDCGIPVPNTLTRITDAERKPLADGQIGHIEISGSSVTSGYYRDPELSAQSINADGWLNTQDLGMLHHGRLYMVGRVKEMIIVGGANYFPHDIELAILRARGLSELNKFVAAGVRSELTGTEELLVFVYYKPAEGELTLIAADIRRHVQATFGLQVSRVVPVRRIPKTTSGKVQRYKLIQEYLDGAYDDALTALGEPRPSAMSNAGIPIAGSDLSAAEATSADSGASADPVADAGIAPDLAEIERRIAALVSRLSGCACLDTEASFFALGLSSLRMVDLRCDVEVEFAIVLDSTSALDFPNVRALSAHVAARLAARTQTPALPAGESRTETQVSTHGEDRGAYSHDPIAIVGMACRFPGGADTPAAYWRLLMESTDPVREVPRDRWRTDPQSKVEIATRQGGFLEHLDQFDPLFFGISPTEAVCMDPQQRLLLEVCHEAIENTGKDPASLSGSRTAVYVGISGSEYAAVGADLGHGTGPYTFTGTMLNAAAGRLSYTFGLQGPSVALDTACSSSLVAVHHSVQALRSGQCDAAIAAGVSLILKTDGHISFSQLNALSVSGRCRSFDDAADGYIRGEGCGAVVLKRLADAECDGDPVLAVIRGTAVNHNGRSGGLTVPNGHAQEQLILDAQRDADVGADRIGYVEAHGSGTRLGDPQELNALARVFADRDRERALYVGSVKSNLGHLESAAGMAGLIKVVQMLRHGRIAPNLHFRTGNRLIDWQRAPFAVADRAIEWSGDGALRCAGISSFGISGTNAHAVLEEYVSAHAKAAVPARDWQVFALGAKSRDALRENARRFAESPILDQAPLDALCRTIACRQSYYPQRFAVAAESGEALKRKLLRYADGGEIGSESAGQTPVDGDIVFLYTGQGSVYPGIARELHAGSRAFRDAFDRCDMLFVPLTGGSLRDVALDADADAAILASPQISQPLIFAMQYALGALWESIGVRPAAVLGHSIGEYAAACRAGAFSLEDAVRMVALRGRIMHEAEADGAMIGVLADEAVVRALVAAHPDTHIAAVNTDSNLTVSGRSDAVKALAAAARKARTFTERLPMQHAFHSPLMAASAVRLREGLVDVRFHAPQVPLLSSQRGCAVTSADALGRDYWSSHLCEPVLFRDALRCAIDEGRRLFLEIGGTAALSGLGAQIAGEDIAFLPSMRQGKSAWQQVCETVASLHASGVRIDWNAWYEGANGVVHDLPNTAYQRSSYWFPQLAVSASHAPVAHAAPAPHSVRALEAPEAAEVQAVAAAADLGASVVADIVEMIGLVTGIQSEEILADVNIFELGIDSLMLAQMDKRIFKRYGTDIPLKLFFAELNSPARIATYLVDQMSEAQRHERLVALGLHAPVQAAAVPIPSTTSIAPEYGAAALTTPGSGLEAIVQAQLALMRGQLALLRGETQAPPPVAVSKSLPMTHAAKFHPAPLASDTGRNALRNMVLHEEDVDARQLAFIRSVVDRVVAKTPKSKAHAQRYRHVLADWIATLNFSLTTKEMAYPVVAERSLGARFWDIDGNEYIDTATGYGATFFGHNPAFVAEALRRQLDEGIELGPQSDLAGEVAELIAEMTGAERVAFCNSGTEAVMVVMRLARTVTRRRKIVRFINSYHGSFDGVLADAGEYGAVPMAPGILESMVADTVVLHYGTPASLTAIREIGDDLAAVLVEPVQSRAPHNYSAGYLRQLRALTEDMGAALIFDEMITGFRTGPGGAQAYFGVRADLSTYGKVAGGGMPIGVVAGKAEYMDAIDGGHWQFGDGSGPMRETTFFAGTFCKHPLAMAAARAVLLELKRDGTALIERVDGLTKRFCERANAFFRAERIPVEAQCFGSLYRFETVLSQDPARSSLEMNLLFRLMLLNGIFVWERRTSFFSLAHTEEDAGRILEAVKRAAFALREGGFSFRAACGDIPPANKSGPEAYPLSSEERRMYVLSLMKGGEYAYHVTGALRIRGRYDVERGERALRALADRHPILRSAYVYGDDGLRHRIEPAIALPMTYRDVAPAPTDALLADVVRGFDLTRAPLWRIDVLRTAEDDRILAMDFHHLIADGISVSLLIEEFCALYRGDALEPAGAGYVEFVRWEQDFVAGGDYAAQRRYWLQTMRPLPPPLELPTDLPRPPQNDFVGASVRFELEPHFFASVRELARRRQSTPFMVLLAAYFVLLQKLTRQQDICIGTPFDRRRNGDFDRTVGMFAQTLAIRVQPTPDLDFATVIDHVRESCSAAYSHADVPLDDLVAQLGIPRDFSRNALFDTMFIYENGNRRVHDIGELSLQPLAVPMRGSAFDLTLEMTEQQGTLHCTMIYATRLFESDTIGRWSKYFERLLGGLLARPETPIDAIHVLDESEERLLLDHHNDTRRDYPRAETVVQRFRARVASDPAHCALSAGGARLSYAELDAASDRLARRLRALGIGTGDLVGIALPREASLIVSMLGVLKAGAAYVPIDPDYPQARIRAMLEYSQTRLVLARDADLIALGLDAAQALDPDATADDTSFAAPPLPEPNADDLAYVIFTSGSTGQPKGVMLEHASVANFVRGMEEALAPLAQPTTLGITSVSFDIFVLEVFLTFACGGTLVLADERAQRDPCAAIALIADAGVKLVQLTPSRLQSMLAVADAEAILADVDHLLIGGEAFPDGLLAALRKAAHLRLFNVYGPTETTVWSTVKRIAPGETRVNLGTPIANTRAYVLDASLNLRPTGCVGDLYLGGDGLARGYFRDDARTAAAFVPDPFLPGARMYRTGDSAAWTATGELTYHGRTDGQIKLRGYRIEIAEIEAQLLSRPEVAMAAVSVRELSPGNPVLVAHYRAAASSGHEAPARFASLLREQLGEQLPAYMVPALLLPVDALPTTPNGKIDRRALAMLPLPSAQEAHAAAGGGVDARAAQPEDAIEAELFAVWKRILGDAPLDRWISFFDAGGNSFSLVTMHAELSKRFPRALEVADLFASPTIASLRARIGESLGAQGDAGPAPLAFPAAYFMADGSGEGGLHAQLDGESNRGFRDTANALGVQPFDLALSLYGLYLNKLLHCQAFELAVASTDGQVRVAFDFARPRTLPELSMDVARQRAGADASRRFASRSHAIVDGLPAHALRMLVVDDDGRTPADRPGFDLALRIRAQDHALQLAIDYDTALLGTAPLRAFAANYLKLIKVLTAAAVPQTTAGAA